MPPAEPQRAETIVIGSGPGGAVTAALLAAAGRQVLLVEEGSHLPLESAPHFSRAEILQKYRNGGITVAMGRAKVAYVEGRVVGGGSEINRGLYHRAPDEVLDGWRRDMKVDALSGAELAPHFEACERLVRVSHLPGPAPRISLLLHEGAQRLGWRSMAVPRLVSYGADPSAPGRKQSMSETLVPRFLAAGGRLVPDTRVRRIARQGGRWRLWTERADDEGWRPGPDLEADTLFVACGAVQTPALLRRSGITRAVGDTLRFHPMIKVVAMFRDEVNQSGGQEPVHQIKEFDPRFSMGCSVSKRPALALAMVDHPDQLAEIDRHWQRMAIYYAQTTGGRASVRPLPWCRDPLVRATHDPQDLRDLAAGLRRLCECLLAAGAVAIYPGTAGLGVLRSEADLASLPDDLPAERANMTALHLFSSCPMGEDEARCATDSFGRVRGVDGLHIADASLLCGPTVVNPQGTVMAVAHRNTRHFLDGGSARAISRSSEAQALRSHECVT